MGVGGPDLACDIDSVVIITVVAFLAGIASVLTPCVLPLLPALLTVSGSGGRRTVLGLVVGIVVSFSAALVAVTALFSAVGAIGNATRWLAVVLLVGIGVLFLVPPWKDRVEAWASRAVSGVRAGDSGGIGGGLLTGLALGVVWTPCAGPILAGVSAAAATQEVGPRTLVNLAAFAVGMAIPLTVIALGGRKASVWLRERIGGRRLDLATGVVLLTTAAFIGFGLDTTVNRWVAENTPFAASLTAELEEQALEQGPGTTTSQAAGTASGPDADLPPLEQLETDGYPEFQDLAYLGAMPELEGLGPWFNTASQQPLTAEDLQGQVVLVDFWTYSCVNCIRTLPYLRDWHEEYADEGLVILGLHAPEFAFEAEPSDVEAAIEDLDVTWPVALDNDFSTWRNFHNRYWPAKYLVDRDGVVRYAHYGEGAYDETEAHIAELLGTPVSEDQDSSGLDSDARSTTAGQTPETYLGYQRGARFAASVVDSPERYVADEMVRYESPETLERDTWGLQGDWRIEGERSVAGEDAVLLLSYYGRDVFLVMGDARPADAQQSAAPVARSYDDGPEGVDREHRLRADRLYVLRDTDMAAEGLMRVEVPAGSAVYAFTFG